MQKNFCFILTYFLVLASPAFSYFEISSDHISVMNERDFKKYRNFPSEWKLVTVRYREDSGELRFTYANSIAYGHILSRSKKPYPEGSIFGKVSFLTDKDPAFTSSKVPTQSRRYQLMVKNSKKYQTTGNWGYALFDSEGKLFKEDMKAKTASCFACHTIVQGPKDYVFSEPMSLAVGSLVLTEKSSMTNLLSWKTLASENRPKTLRAPKEMKMDQLESPMNKAFFSGTLDELVPLLIEKSGTSKTGAIFLGDSDNFSATWKQGDCQIIQVHFQGKDVRFDQQCR